MEAVPHVISLEQNSDLLKPFSSDEFVLVVKQLGSLKAPGPDGFPGQFYKNLWEVVKDNVNRAISNFSEDSCSVDIINKTNIVLIPKVPYPESLDQYRPISLCNNSIKLISKLLANRIKPLLPQMIFEHQNAFIPGK